ncbi:hypothetical protein QBC34DRAFT_418958 [Podospora aff. communis PSN243]|uniref:Uncharacterized protein n=1 Tax=Podospora aff. communis PSN243 TaxID=3040156 RepID=A0AAV9G0T2_9PEZI|nr:hypothetical protein QBC34DRAFT_418958 [Podospora aff. communis PSN243]
MHPSTLFLTLTTLLATATADCSASWAAPDDGEIALYRDSNCKGEYLNVGALNSCQSWPDFDACSAKTRAGIVCDIYKSDGCPTTGDYVATIDSAGYRSFCGAFRDNIQSLQCRVG